MIDDQVHEFDLVRGERLSGKETREGFFRRRTIETDQRPHEQTEAVAGLGGTLLSGVIPLDLVPALLVFFGEVVVSDPMLMELQRYRDRTCRDEKAVLHRILEVYASVGTPRSRSNNRYVSWSTSSFGVAVRPTSSESKYSKMPWTSYSRSCGPSSDQPASFNSRSMK